MKKLFAICLSLFLVITPLWATAVECTAPMTKGYKGDVNVDGKIDARDALLTLQIRVSKYPYTAQEHDAADVNHNGYPEATDALEILKYAVKKPSVLTRGVRAIAFDYGVRTGWTVLKDNIYKTQQAWLCQSYEEYKAFMALGYVDETQRSNGWNQKVEIPPFDEGFFETHGLVLFYRPRGLGSGDLAYKGVQVRENYLYLDISLYYTCVIDSNDTMDIIYGFWFPKGEQPCTTVIVRENAVGEMYSSFSLSQFDFPQS